MALVPRNALRTKAKGSWLQAFSSCLLPRRDSHENRPSWCIYLFGKFMSFSCVDKLFVDSLCLGAQTGQVVAVNLHKHDTESFYLKMTQTTVQSNSAPCWRSRLKALEKLEQYLVSATGVASQHLEFSSESSGQRTRPPAVEEPGRRGPRVWALGWWVWCALEGSAPWAVLCYL